MGVLESERFIALIKREQFGYIKWRDDLFKDVPMDELLAAADEYRKSKKSNLNLQGENV